MVYVIFFNQEILSLLEALWLPQEIVIVHYKQHQKGQSTKGPMNQDSRVGQPEGSPRTRFGCHAQIWIASAPKLHIGKKITWKMRDTYQGQMDGSSCQMWDSYPLLLLEDKCSPNSPKLLTYKNPKLLSYSGLDIISLSYTISWKTLCPNVPIVYKWTPKKEKNPWKESRPEETPPENIGKWTLQR